MSPWIHSSYLQSLHYTIQFCGLKHCSVLTNLKHISLMQSSLVNSRIIYPTASSEAPHGCSRKHLRLSIYKLNWSPPEQSSSPGNLLLLDLRLKNWEFLLPHTPCNAPGNSVSSIFKISPEPSLFLPLPLLPHPSGPPITCIVVTISCFYPCLWPPSYSSQTNFCKNFSQIMALYSECSTALHLTQCKGVIMVACKALHHWPFSFLSDLIPTFSRCSTAFLLVLKLTSPQSFSTFSFFCPDCSSPCIGNFLNFLQVFVQVSCFQ